MNHSQLNCFRSADIIRSALFPESVWVQQKQYLHFMVLFQLPFVDQDKTYTAEVSLEGIRDSWDARVIIADYPGDKELRVKFWLGDFLMPVFSSRKNAQLFEPLLEAIDVQAKVRLPEEFGD